MQRLPFLASWSRRAASRSLLWQPKRDVQAAVLAEPHFKALLLDATGTLIYPSEPAAEVRACCLCSAQVALCAAPQATHLMDSACKVAMPQICKQRRCTSSMPASMGACLLRSRS